MENGPQPGGAYAGRGLGETDPLNPPGRQRHLAGNVWWHLYRLVRANTLVPSWLPARLRHPVFGYLAAVILEVIAVVLTLLLAVIFPGFSLFGVLVTLMVLVIALSWGGSPSLFAMLVGVGLLYYSFVQPQFSWGIKSRADMVGLGLVLVVGLLISLVAGQAARARRQTDQACQEAEARAAQLRTVFETLVDGILVYDQHGHAIQQNSAARTLLGLNVAPGSGSGSVAEPITSPTLRDTQGQPLSVEQAPLSRVLRGEILTGEAGQDVWMQTPDGQEVLVSITGAPIRNRQGQQLGAVLLGRDVTERYRLEQRTQKALDALIQMAYALVAAPTGEAALSGTLAQRLAAFITEALGEEQVILMGWEPETGTLYPLMATGLAPEQETLLRARFKDGRRLDEWWGPGVAAHLEEGEVVHIAAAGAASLQALNLPGMQQCLLAPLLGERHLIGFLALGRPESGPPFTSQEETLLGAVAHLCALVLERERLFLAREEARAHILALREANEQMDAFLGIAGHELKTPLASLKLSIQMAWRAIERLSRHEAGAIESLSQVLPKIREQLMRIQRQTNRLNRLVDDLLDVSRVQANQLNLRLDTADLVSIVRQVVEEQQEAAPTRAIQVQLPAGGHLPLRADADRVGQVATNYLTNALKYSPPDQPVEVGVEQHGQFARVWVHDWGSGIPAAEQKRLWERFYRVPGIEVQSGLGVGLGMGLYISRSIIERHGGQVGVQSAPGEGTTFWFTLPLEQQDEPATSSGSYSC